MINVKGLTVKYADHTVLNDVSIQLDAGCIHGIAGLNGAGKTTFFNMLAKMDKPGAGIIEYDNTPVNSKDTAYLETVNYFFPGITGNEYLKIFRQTNPRFSLQVLQEFFKLPLDELIEHYSTGMRKKLALLSVLKQEKPIYILDEPFNGLDLETNKVLEIILSTLKQKGKIILLSSHILEPLLTVCDKIHLLENGQFTKSFEKHAFDHIEDTLFRKLKEEALQHITNAI